MQLPRCPHAHMGEGKAAEQWNCELGGIWANAVTGPQARISKSLSKATVQYNTLLGLAKISSCNKLVYEFKLATVQINVQ